jgi:hypothetical protein
MDHLCRGSTQIIVGSRDTAPCCHGRLGAWIQTRFSSAIRCMRISLMSLRPTASSLRVDLPHLARCDSTALWSLYQAGFLHMNHPHAACWHSAATVDCYFPCQTAPHHWQDLFCVLCPAFARLGVLFLQYLLRIFPKNTRISTETHGLCVGLVEQ